MYNLELLEEVFRKGNVRQVDKHIEITINVNGGVVKLVVSRDDYDKILYGKK